MVVLFEDTSYRYKLEQLFTQHGIQFKSWEDYSDLEKKLRENEPKLALLDVQIKDKTEAGLHALKTIKENFPRIKTIMLTGHPEYVLKAFRLGADGYLLKEELPDSIEYIKEVMKEVATGGIPMTEEVKKIVVESLRPFEPIKKELNTRELQIIYLAASDKTGPEIASALKLSSKTIETYLRNIRGKLNCHTIQGVVAKAFRSGLIDKDLFIP